MAQRIKFGESCHWYSNAGEPDHDATLREARKKFLFASPSSIDKQEFVNEFLNKWKLEEVAYAAADNFRQPHESPDDYAQRIYEISLNKAQTAAEFGKKVHKSLQDYPALPTDPTIAPWFEHFHKWQTQAVLSSLERELIVVDTDLGVAGQLDLLGLSTAFPDMLTVWDYKTQNVKTDAKGRKTPKFYESWPRQLAFYSGAFAKRAGTWPNLPRCVSVVIDSNEPSAPYVKEWDPQEIKSSWEDFAIASYRFYKRKTYWPVGQWKLGAMLETIG